MWKKHPRLNMACTIHTHVVKSKLHLYPVIHVSKTNSPEGKLVQRLQKTLSQTVPQNTCQ